MSTPSALAVSRSRPASAIHVAHGAEALVLRPCRVGDAAEILGAVIDSLPELKRFMPWAHAPATLEQQIDRLRDGESAYATGTEMVMGLFRAQRLLAMVGLHPRIPLNPNGLEVGYWAPTRFAGRGYTTLAVRVAVVYAFDKLGVDRLQVMHDEANVASRRVVEKCGFEREGILRNVTAPPTPELVAGGYAVTGRSPLYALFPDTFAAQPWVPELRPNLTFVASPPPSTP